MAILYDAENAKSMALATAIFASSDYAGDVLFSLFHFADTLGSFQWKHIKSHDGHPCNELADAICTASYSQELLIPMSSPLSSFVRSQSALMPWLWLTAMPQSY